MNSERIFIFSRRLRESLPTTRDETDGKEEPRDEKGIEKDPINSPTFRSRSRLRHYYYYFHHHGVSGGGGTTLVTPSRWERFLGGESA